MRHQWQIAGALSLLLMLSASAQTPDSLPGCTYNVTPPVLATGQQTTWQCDANGRLLTTASAGGGTVTNVATAGLATGGPIATTGTVTVTAATQADLEAATSNVAAVTPLRVQNHPGVAKAWAECTQAAGVYTLAANYNISGATCGKTATGRLTVGFTTPFSSTTYACVMTLNTFAVFFVSALATTTVNLGIQNVGATDIDASFYLVCYGDQ